MQLVAADLLEDACGLSPGLAATALVIGAMLWLFGWWSHRFWLVLVATVLAGVYGLVQAPALHAPALPTAVLLALSAGLLALAMIRVFAFVVAGVAMVLLSRALAPSWNQPVLVFLSSGLVCVCLFRLFLTALTSAAGALLIMYSALVLLHTTSFVTFVAWPPPPPTVLNVAWGLLASFGFAFQIYFHRRNRRDRDKEGEQREGILRLPRVLSWVGGTERDAA
jgi:hypothetical protein